MQAKPLAIGDTLAYQTGQFVIRLQYVRADAYTVVVECGTLRIAELSKGFANEDHARTFAREVAKRLRDGATVAEVVAAVHPAPRLAPAAKGTTLKVTDPQHAALATAATVGQVLRGRFEDGRAPVRTLNALARRRFIDLTYRYEGRRRIVTGATITALGLRRLAELDATAAHTPMTIAA